MKKKKGISEMECEKGKTASKSTFVTNGKIESFASHDRINTDPFGSWTGVVNEGDQMDKPVQDADDL